MVADENGHGRDWFGARSTLEDRGVDFSGRWSAVYASVVSGGLQRRSSFVEQLRFEPDLDFAGVTAPSARPKRVQSRLFSGGYRWRAMPFYLTYTALEFFGKKEFLTLSGGWQNH